MLSRIINNIKLFIHSLFTLKDLKSDTDSLFFKVQRGEIDNQIWLDKIAEIKALSQEALIINVRE